MLCGSASFPPRGAQVYTHPIDLLYLLCTCTIERILTQNKALAREKLTPATPRHATQELRKQEAMRELLY